MGPDEGSPTTQVAFVLFVLLCSIIIMNLLVGLAIRYFQCLLDNVIEKFSIFSEVGHRISNSFFFESSNITGQFVEAGIHRLRTTIHLVRIIDDTLGYLRPRCPIQFPYLQGSSILSSQLFYYLLSRRYPNYKTHIAEHKKKERDQNVSFKVSKIVALKEAYTW